MRASEVVAKSGGELPASVDAEIDQSRTTREKVGAGSGQRRQRQEEEHSERRRQFVLAAAAAAVHKSN